MRLPRRTKKENVRIARPKSEKAPKVSIFARLNPFKKKIKRKDNPQLTRPKNAAQIRKSAVNDITKKRLADARKRRVRTILDKINIGGFLGSPLFKFLIILPIIVLAVALVINFRNSSNFSIKNINIIIDDQSKVAIAQGVLDNYKGKNLFTLDRNAMVNDLKAKIPDTSQVFINKTIQGNLTVEIVRDVPTFYAVNLSGSYLLNQNSKVIAVLPNAKPINLTESDKIILNGGTIDPNSDLVRIKYLGKIDDEDARKAVVWKDVPLDDKKKTVEDLQTDFTNNINSYFNTSQDQLKTTDFYKLVGSFYRSSTVYNIGDSFNHDELNFLAKLFDFFKTKTFPINRVVWTSDFTAQFELESKPVIIFSMKRDLGEQTTDINTLIYYGQFENQKVIDVRSSNYVIIH